MISNSPRFVGIGCEERDDISIVEVHAGGGLVGLVTSGWLLNRNVSAVGREHDGIVALGTGDLAGENLRTGNASEGSTDLIDVCVGRSTCFT